MCSSSAARGDQVVQFIRALVLTVAVTIAPSFAQTPSQPEPTGPRLVVAKSRVVPGEEVSVPIVIGAAPDVGAVQAEVVYDGAALELKSIEKGRMLSEHSTLEADTRSPGRAVVRILSPQQPLEGDGELFKARFATRSDSPQAGHRITLRDVKAWRVERSQGDSSFDQSEVSLAAYAGELRIVDKPV